MSRVLVVAVHPDDETLGCGGALLRHRERGDDVHWLIVTNMCAASGFSRSRIAMREAEIERVARFYGFAGTHSLGFPTTALDSVPMTDVVRAASASVKEVAPDSIYLPFAHDAHSDHRVAFMAFMASLKSFRASGVARIVMMETLSETNMAVPMQSSCFVPQLYIDVSATLEGKIEAMSLYDGESGAHPFPRSAESIRSLAMLRGSEVGFDAAEAFMLVREVVA